MINLFWYIVRNGFCDKKVANMQYVFGGPNWQINKQTKFGSSLFCVCVDCVGVVFHFQGHQILVL